MSKFSYFLSDLHLGAKYIDNPKEHERRIVEWLDSIKESADEIYLLGDILDYWYEYKYVVPRGFTRFFGKIAELSDLGVKIYWFIGNHDIWIFDYLPQELGITVIDGSLIKEIKGKRFYLAHGDGVGVLKQSFKLLRVVFRNKLCQTLFSAIHPRWTIPFAHGWSSHSRESHKGSNPLESQDLRNLIDFVHSYSRNDNNIDYYVFGHLHCVVNEKLTEKASIVVLGDWVNIFSYGIYDGENLQIEYYPK